MIDKIAPVISDDEIAEHAIVCWPALQEHERRSFQLVAKAQRDDTVKKIVEWGDESCPHWNELVISHPYQKRHGCMECWQELERAVKE